MIESAGEGRKLVDQRQKMLRNAPEVQVYVQVQGYGSLTILQPCTAITILFSHCEYYCLNNTVVSSRQTFCLMWLCLSLFWLTEVLCWTSCSLVVIIIDRS